MERVKQHTRGTRTRQTGAVLLWASLIAVTGVIVSCSSDDRQNGNGITNPDAGIATTVIGATNINLIDPATRPFSVNVAGALFNSGGDQTVGTGNLHPFLRVQGDPVEEGFNTENANPLLDTKTGTWTKALPLNQVPVVGIGGTGYREFTFDANESSALFDMLIFDVWLCDDLAAANYNTLAQISAGCTKVYGLPTNTALNMTDAFSKGSGNGADYRILVPETNFQAQITANGIGDSCNYGGPTAEPCGAYIILHTKMNGSDGTDGGFEEFSTVDRPYVTVSKTVSAALTRTYNWQISKSVDPTTITQFGGQSTNALWTINVTAGTPAFTDGATSVSGVITVTNPSEETVSVLSVTDAVDGGSFGTATISSCTGGDAPTVGSPRALASDASFTCNYSMTTIPNTTVGEHTNTASASIASSVAGEDPALFNGSATFDFTNATITSVNQNPNVYDNNNAAGEVLKGTASQSSFTYTVSYSCGASRTVSNVARLDLAPVGTATADPTATASLTINCLDLTVTKTAATSVNRTFLWSLSKSATPTTWNLFNGDQGTTVYTVTASPNGFSDAGLTVNGDITIHNPNSVPVYIESLPTDAMDGAGGPLSATVTCPNVGTTTVFPYTLAANADLICSYTRSLPDAINRTNTATVSAKPTNLSAAVAKNFTGTAAVTPGTATATETNRTVTVTDNFNAAGATTLGTATWGTGTTPGAPTVYTPQHTFACSADQGVFGNVAAITGTSLTASASVTVNCHTLSVAKTATPSYTKTWTWGVLKGVTPNDLSLILAVNEQYIAGYSVAYTRDAGVESEWKVDGTITVSNTAPIAAVITALPTDVLTPAGAATVTCAGIDFPYTLAATNGVLNCTYTKSLASKTDQTNVATALRQKYSYSSTLVATPNSTQSYSNTAPVNANFALTPTKAVDECATVSDTYSSSSVAGPICASQTFTYNRTLQYATCGLQPNIVNTASFTSAAGTSGTGTNVSTPTTGNSVVTITVDVTCPPVNGCTLTQGYWKTHNVSFKGGAPPDDRWLDLPNDEQSGFFTTDAATSYPTTGPNPTTFTWFNVFWTAPKGDPYYQLAHQYMAAKLNVLNGADPTLISATLALAEDYFDSFGPTGKGAPKALKSQLVGWAGTLGAYNEGTLVVSGQTGPPHCDQDNTSVTAF